MLRRSDLPESANASPCTTCYLGEFRTGNSGQYVQTHFLRIGGFVKDQSLQVSRIARAVVEGVAHHITQRGNGRQVVFDTRKDRQLYLDLLRECPEVSTRPLELLSDEQSRAFDWRASSVRFPGPRARPHTCGVCAVPEHLPAQLRPCLASALFLLCSGREPSLERHVVCGTKSGVGGARAGGYRV